MNYEHRRHPYMQPHINQINRYDNVKGPNEKFLGHQNRNWLEIRERAAEILAGKMWTNPGKL